MDRNRFSPEVTIAGKFEINTAKNGELIFNLKASNGQIIFTSEMYNDESARDNGIASVKTNAPTAETVDTK